MAKNAIKVGDLVEWIEPDGRKLFGLVERINEATKTAEATLYILNDGKLTASATRKKGVPTSKLKITSKPLSDSETAEMSNREFLNYARGGHLPVDTDAADLSDDAFYQQLQSQRGRSSTEVAEARQGGREKADLTESTDLTTQQLVEGYKAELSGEAADLRHRSRVNAEREELLDYWLAEHRAGNVLPRDLEEELRDLGRIG
jgi:hypothetical protein